MVFSASPGRSGSGFLAFLLGASVDVNVGHERLPVMADTWLRRVARYGLEESHYDRRVKAETIRAEMSRLPIGVVYADSSHMFIKTFADVVFEEFQHDLISVVVLRRDPVSVAQSFFQLDELGPQRRAWHDFMPIPTATGMRFVLDVEEVESQFDLIFGCLVDNVVRTHEFRTETPDVNWVDAELSQIVTAHGAQKLFEQLCIVVPPDLMKIVNHRVNEKLAEKRAQSQSVSRALVADRLHRFLERFGDRPEVKTFIRHYSLEVRR